MRGQRVAACQRFQSIKPAWIHGGDSVSKRDHWENVYGSKASDTVSWYQPHAARSLWLIQSTQVGKDGVVLDVGGGASTLVDDLLDSGFT